jgi:DNA-binding transcriptional ArsR family regulator
MVVKEQLRSMSLTDLGKALSEPTGGTEDETDLPLKHTVPGHLSPEAREMLIRESIRQAVKNYGGAEGLTVEEVIKMTGFSRPSVSKHLAALSSLREVFSIKKNDKLRLYFPNGRPLHSVGKVRLDKVNHIFEISLNQGPRDELFFYVQERRYSLMEGERTEGAVMIPVEHADEFVKALYELKERAGGVK